MSDETAKLAVPREAPGARNMAGLEFLNKIVAGELPVTPMWRSLGISLLEAEAGRTLFRVEPRQDHANTNGVAHGGLAATLIDSAASCAVITETGPGDWSTTVALEIKFIRPIPVEEGPVFAEGRTIRVGRRMGTAEARITDADGRLLGHGSCTCLIERRKA
ncbi:MAG: PaaI family thioesterase [Rhodospirillaceae bacterium]|nr:PaaI family thioesterase [Rhodospirillaceae bacterium]